MDVTTFIPGNLNEAMRQKATIAWLLTLCTCSTALPPPHHLMALRSHPVVRSIPTQDEIGDDDPNLLRKDRIRRQEKLAPKIEGKYRNLPKTVRRSRAVTPQDIVWEKEDKVKDKIQTCDQYNAPGRYMIYCQGKLLQAVMATQLYKDSKTFVDRPLKEGREGAKVLAEFEKQFPQPVSEIKVEEVRAFVDANFDQEGHELKEPDENVFARIFIFKILFLSFSKSGCDKLEK
ncbi:hypothetical protein Y032_0009g439 [Ancylostoma ceylanicum]|nr:hypothetical protein Y032_0009g439 [Ancylostoma ceylanicum]